LVLGGATVYFHNADFIKWKPTGLYWAAGAGLFLAQLLFKKNGIKALMSAQISLPDAIWTRLNYIWASFFVLMGFVNIYVAYNFSTDIWVNFKLFGLMGMMLVFVIGQGVYLSRYMTDDKNPQ
jgi:intracellular septation protein